MSARFDVVERWPELFDSLTPEQRAATTRALAAGWHEGWQPNREDVADLIEFARGALTMDEYRARSAEKAQRIADDAYYAEMSERAERGELRTIPGTILRGPAAAAEAQRLLAEAGYDGDPRSI